MKQHLVRGFRFGITGLANTGIHALVAVLCLEGFFLGVPWLVAGPVVANGVAFVVATVFSYVVNTVWSFSTSINRKNFQRFVVVAVIGLVAAMGLARLAELIGLPPLGGVVLVICVMPLVNFGLHSLWTYR
jgi:putative flippase GtrA